METAEQMARRLRDGDPVYGPRGYLVELCALALAADELIDCYKPTPPAGGDDTPAELVVQTTRGQLRAFLTALEALRDAGLFDPCEGKEE